MAVRVEGMSGDSIDATTEEKKEGNAKKLDCLGGIRFGGGVAWLTVTAGFTGGALADCCGETVGVETTAGSAKKILELALVLALALTADFVGAGPARGVGQACASSSLLSTVREDKGLCRGVGQACASSSLLSTVRED